MSEQIRVLFVDDDERLLGAVKRVLRRKMNLHTAQGADEALAALKAEGNFAVVVSDQNMPGMKGVEFLAKAAEIQPLAARVMLTGNNDQETAANAVNQGHVFRFVTKPCSTELLYETIKDAARHHSLMAAERDLLERALSGSVKVLMDVLALSSPVSARRAETVRTWARALAQRTQIDRAWELDMAAMLWPLGEVTLPAELLEKHHAGAPLDQEEEALLAGTPAIGRDLIGKIPRLEGIAEAVYYCRANCDGSGNPGDGCAGDKLPLNARILRVLIDLAQARSDLTRDGLLKVLQTMAGKTGQYDTNVLKFVRDAVQSDDAMILAERRVSVDVAAPALIPGDVVEGDIATSDGKLLLAAGTELTAPLIQKLKNVSKLRGIDGPFKVQRLESAMELDECA